MPVGPSHSGRSHSSSGGGSHSFGGGSRGSSFSSSGPRSHNHQHGGQSHGFHTPFFRPRTYHFFGRTAYLTSGFQILISIIAFFILFSLLIFISSFNSINYKKEYIEDYKQQIVIMESDAVFFNELIDNAKNNVSGYYTTTATFGSTVYEYYMSNPTKIGIYEAFEDDGVIWYFLVYEYKNTEGNTMIGTTYTQFSAGQYNALNGKIQIAYTEVDGEWWSINTSYSLDTNRDYILAKADLEYYEISANSSIKSSVFWGLICVGLVSVIILILVKKSKKIQTEDALAQEKTKAEIAEAQAKAEQEQRKAAQINRTCPYCGSSVPDSAIRCPDCGANDFNLK